MRRDGLGNLLPFIQNLIDEAGLGEVVDMFIKTAKPKLKMIEHVTLKKGELVPINLPVTKIWRVKNNGVIPWPAGLQLVLTRGDVQALEEPVLGEVMPGHVIEIEVPMLLTKEGTAKGVWRLQGEKSFGKLNVAVEGVEVDPSQLDKVRQLVKLGFSVEQAKMGLQATQGNMEAAVSHIFSTI